MSDNYQVFFRTKRGGCGIDYEAAKAEFLSVFGKHRVKLNWEIPGRMRIDIAITGLSTEEVSQRAEMLGYTQGIVSVHEEPYLGGELHSRRVERWAVGWLRKGDKKILLTEIYRQDQEKMLSEAPHNREFLIEREGEVKTAKGHRYHRGMSPADARFILNIAELRGSEFILDPFAGLGGILAECGRRNLRVIGTDIDPILRHGLAQVSNNRSVVADARQLPFEDSIFDVIITEPPFVSRYRQAVLDSIGELLRVIGGGEKIVFLIAKDMHQQIMTCMADSQFQLTRDFTLRRHGNLTSHVLRFDHKTREMQNDTTGSAGT